MSVGAAYAQPAIITGQVTDAETGDPLPGANVIIAETTLGTITNVDGRYVITDVPARSQPYIVRASFTGFTTGEQTVAVPQAGATVSANFALRSGVQLDAVVVTALGIERAEREIGYSVSQIRGDEVTRGDNTNLISQMSGRIAGLDVVQSSGNIGASTRVLIRGVTSLSGENQPLFVVDGVPISNANIAPMSISGQQSRIQGAPDVGNRANDINPADIETVSVLRGGAAAALYGSRAANGVILITTRRGLDRPRAQVQVSSSVLGNTLGRMPDFHNEYAGGTFGRYDHGDFAMRGWGPVIAGQSVSGTVLDRSADGTIPEGTPRVTLAAAPNNVRDFFQTGVSTTNSIAFNTGTPTSDFRLGLTRIGQSGIVPGSELTRTSVSINAGTRLANRFTARVTGNYVVTDDAGRAAAGSNDPNVLVPLVMSIPRTLDITQLRQYRTATGQHRTFGPMTNNPYWIVNENRFTSDVQRIMGNGTIGYAPLDWVNLSVRVGTDFYTQNRRQRYSPGTLQRVDGGFVDDVIQQNETNVDFLAQVNRPITEEFSFQGILGSNVSQREFQRNTNISERLAVEGVWNPGNVEQNAPSLSSSQQRLYGFFGDVTLGWRNAVFLNLTGRNDFSSTLPVESRSYFYPSAALSVVFTDLVNIDPNVLSYGKARLNAARVGSDEAPYQLAFRFFPVESAWSQFNTHVFFPYLGELTAFDGASTMPPTALRPQMQTTYEIGTEFGFLRDRLSLDLTFYDQLTTDQILSLPAARSTGFAAVRMNAGEVSNRGIEATLNANTVEIGQFAHSFRTTFARNRNRVTELADDVEYIRLHGGFVPLEVGAAKGESLGLYGRGWLRDPETGLPVINPETGLRETSNEIIRHGNVDPDFRLGFTNTFRYGPVSLNALIDWRQGGVLYSETVQNLRWRGLAEETTFNREGTFIDRGVIVTERNADGDIIATRPNDVPVTSMQSFWQQYHTGAMSEGAVFDATFVKLREVSVTFDLPRSLLQRSPFGQASLSVEGRNLALLYSRIPHIDPETNTFGSGTIAGGAYEMNNLPSTRSFGVNLSLTF